MTEAQMRELVSSTFKIGWTAAQPGVDFALENEGRALPPSGSLAFAHQSVVLTTSAQMTQGAAGTRRVRRDGWIQVKLWTPGDKGAAPGAVLADSVRAILEMIEMPSPVTGDEPVVTGAGPTLPIGSDARWWMQLARIPMYFVQTK